MTVTAVRKDPAALTMTIDRRVRRLAGARLAAVGRSAPARALVGPADLPRDLHPHDLAPGGRVEYHMTGPTGDQPRGYWDVVEVDPPNRLVVPRRLRQRRRLAERGLAAAPRCAVTIEAIGDGRTRMSIESHFPSTEAMEQVLAMGMEEGLTEAVGQIDAILAEDAVAGERR